MSFRIRTICVLVTAHSDDINSTGWALFFPVQHNSIHNKAKFGQVPFIC